MNFTIKKGGVRATHWKRAFFWLLPTWRKRHRMKVTFTEGGSGGGKLWGFARPSLRWNQAHGDSDRFNYEISGDKVKIRAGYAYRDGDRVSDMMSVTVSLNTRITMLLEERKGGVYYEINGSTAKVSRYIPHGGQSPWWQPLVPLFAHADNGPRQPVAPERVAFTASKGFEVLRHVVPYSLALGLLIYLLTNLF